MKSRVFRLAAGWVLVLCVTAAQGATSVWNGATGSWFQAGNWIGGLPGVGSDVSITNGSVFLDAETPVLNQFQMSGGTLTFSNWTTRLMAAEVILRAPGKLTHAGPFNYGVAYMSNRVYVVCTNLTIESGGLIDADGKGYAWDQGPGKALTKTFAGGAGHGGRGGDGSGSFAGVPYDLTNAPAQAGSGGGSYQDTASYRGGAGGGIIRLEVSGTAAIDGTLTAGGSAGGTYAGGGSGGAIWLTCGVFGGTTNGLIQTRGGNALYNSDSGSGGGGAGGRIAVGYAGLDAQRAVRFCATPGTGWRGTNWNSQWHEAAEPGTVSFPDGRLLSGSLTDRQFADVCLYFGSNRWAVDSLTVSNCSLVFAEDGFQLTVTNGCRIENGYLGFGRANGSDAVQFSVGQDLILTNAGRVYVYSGVTNSLAPDAGAVVGVTGSLVIGSGSWIYPFSHQTNGGAVRIEANRLAVSSNGGINADGKGYSYDAGPGKGIKVTYAGGGGHGGKGGDGTGGGSYGGAANGFPSLPVSPGSGGGSYEASPNGRGGLGGGVVRLFVTQDAIVDGTLTADGGLGGNASGGGAGGAIHLACGTFGGAAGKIQAQGGTVWNLGNASVGGGGGGGRIAVTYTTLADPSAVQFSVLPAPGRICNTPGDRRVSQLGTLYFSDTNILKTNLTVFNGTVTIPGFSSWSVPTLSVSNATVGFADHFQLTVSGDVLVQGSNGCLVMGTNSLVACGGNFVLTNAGSLRVYSGPTNGAAGAYGALVAVTGDMVVATNAWVYPYSDLTNGGSPLFRMNGLRVASGGGFLADGAGYVSVQGPGKTLSVTYAGGAGHGGKGGNGKTGIGGSVYGSSNAPITAGSGGGSYTAGNPGRGGCGGGVIRIEAADAVTLDGTLRASGGVTENAAGAGAGGSIFVTCASFSGRPSGQLKADGGLWNNNSGGGGGGRIAVAMALSAADRDSLLNGAPVSSLYVYQTHNPFAGSVSVASGFGYTNMPPGGAEPGTALFMTTKWTLSIVGDPSAYGAPSPRGYGTHADVPDFAVVTNGVSSPVDQAAGLRHTCFGWTQKDSAGNLVDSGSTTQAVFALTTNLVLSWRWTNEYQLAVSASANGSVNSGAVDGWYTNGTPVTTILATPDPGYGFFQWTGGFPPGHQADNPLTVVMDQARTLTANFVFSAGQTNVWSGSNAWESVTNWSLGAMPGPLDEVMLTNGTVLIGSAVNVSTFTVGGGAQAVFTNWTTKLEASNVTVRSGGKLTSAGPFNYGGASMSNRVNVVCTNLTVEPGGTIDADGKGYLWDQGPGKANAAQYAGGGGHGGRGGDGSVTFGGAPCGARDAPVQPGSGGGSYQDTAGNRGGAGGGSIRLEVSGTAMIDGVITAGGGLAGSYSGGGAGGSIWLTCGVLAGSTNGLIQARGGNGNYFVDSGSGGGGSGGRIAVGYGSLGAQHAVRFCATPGTGWRGTNWNVQWHEAAEPGTLSVPDGRLLSGVLTDRQFADVRLYFGTNQWAVDSLTVSSCSLVFAEEGFQLTVTNGCRIENGYLGLGRTNGSNAVWFSVGQDLVLTNAGRLYVYSGMTNDLAPEAGARVSVGGSLEIGTASWVYPYAHQVNGGSVLIEADRLAVLAGGGINADGKGYVYDAGPGKGVAGTYAGGGGHGGAGGEGIGGTSGGFGGSVNDFETAPLSPGSGGGSYEASPNGRGGLGGGVIRLAVTNDAIVDGTLTAEGGLGGNASGGGAGGSIVIGCATFGGLGGRIQARGGSCWNVGSASCGGGGGGGRISVNYSELAGQQQIRFSAAPGTGRVFASAGDRRASWPGTIALPTTNLVMKSPLDYDGFVKVPGFTAWSTPALRVSHAAPALPDGFQLAVLGDVAVATNGILLLGNGAQMTVGGGLWVTNGGQLRVYGAPTNGVAGDWGALVDVAGDLRIGAGSWIYPCSDITNGGAPRLRCDRLFVDNGGGINADAAGYRDMKGPGAGQTIAFAGGAGHGGPGGNGSAGAGGVSYGSTNVPVCAGSGGGTYLVGTVGHRGGYGGGVIRVEAAGDMTVDGTLRACGESSGNASGGGAGGSILLAGGGGFAGGYFGELRAQGGPGLSQGGGGGGGRVAVWRKVNGTMRDRLLSGDERRAVTNAQDAGFLGALYVEGGIGWQNGGTGSASFVSVPPGQGVVIWVY